MFVKYIKHILEEDPDIITGIALMMIFIIACISTIFYGMIGIVYTVLIFSVIYLMCGMIGFLFYVYNSWKSFKSENELTIED